MHPGLEHGVIGRGGPSKWRAIPAPHIVWPGGLVNLVLLTVAKGGPCNRLSASESTRVPGVIISPVVQLQPPSGIRAEQKRKETVEYFPPAGSSVWIIFFRNHSCPDQFPKKRRKPLEITISNQVFNGPQKTRYVIYM